PVAAVVAKLLRRPRLLRTLGPERPCPLRRLLFQLSLPQCPRRQWLNPRRHRYPPRLAKSEQALPRQAHLPNRPQWAEVRRPRILRAAAESALQPREPIRSSRCSLAP